MRFFFYGTLLDGSDNAVARAIHARLQRQGPASATGILHAIPDAEGWFPALLPGDGVVQGVLYDTQNALNAAELALIDTYEDCNDADPASALYRRETIVVAAGDGTSVPAQAYLFNQPLPDGARPIPGGDFRSWIAAGGLPVFGGTRAR